MRIASWNLSHAVKRDPARRAKAWQYLASLDIDIAMVQEAGRPIEFVAQSVEADNPDERNWTTSVVSYGPMLQQLQQPVRPSWNRDLEFSIPDAARPGTLALAIVEPAGAAPLLAVSLYGKLRYASQSVLRASSDLVPIFDTPVGKRVVLAGDLNMHTAARDEVERSCAVHALGLLEALGLRDLMREAATKGLLQQDATPCPCAYKPCSHVRTHRHRRHNANAIGSIDYMFATAAIADRLQSMTVLNAEDDPAWRHSDHAPLIAQFDL